jgi:hypothetical protein
MGRRKKIANSRSRSFLLPNDLLEKIETAARFQNRDVSDVVREILEENIQDYLSDSHLLSLERLQEAVDAVQADPLVCEFFERLKDEAEPMLPLNRLDQRQILTLHAGLDGYRKLKTEGRQLPKNIKAWQAGKGLLSWLFPHGGLRLYAKYARRLNALVGICDQVKVFQEAGDWIIEVQEPFASFIDEEEVVRALKSLQTLIQEKKLCRDELGERKCFRRYKVLEPSFSEMYDEDVSATKIQ